MDHHSGAGDGENGGPGASDEDVDRTFREVASSLMVPHQNECMICFLMRAMVLLEPSGFAMTDIYRKFNAPRATKLAARLVRMGVYGDSELLEAVS